MMTQASVRLSASLKIVVAKCRSANTRVENQKAKRRRSHGPVRASGNRTCRTVRRENRSARLTKNLFKGRRKKRKHTNITATVASCSALVAIRRFDRIQSITQL
jgi:hypothetical protein